MPCTLLDEKMSYIPGYMQRFPKPIVEIGAAPTLAVVTDSMLVLRTIRQKLDQEISPSDAADTCATRRKAMDARPRAREASAGIKQAGGGVRNDIAVHGRVVFSSKRSLFDFQVPVGQGRPAPDHSALIRKRLRTVRRLVASTFLPMHYLCWPGTYPAPTPAAYDGYDGTDPAACLGQRAPVALPMRTFLPFYAQMSRTRAT